jgi:site-specific DNA recombinase
LKAVGEMTKNKPKAAVEIDGRRAVLYARVSGDDRDNEGRNLKSQIALGRLYAKEHGYIVIDELSEDDRGASGADFDLPKLSQALEMAIDGKFDVLLVREIDRFARGLAKQIIVEEQFKRAGVKIEYVIGEYPDTPEGQVQKNFKAVIAEYEREKIRERIMRGQRNKVEGGSIMPLGGQGPLGYKVVECDHKWALEVYEPEARTVRMIFSLYTMGDAKTGPLSIISIARKLESLAVPSFADLRPNNRPKKIGRGKWGRSSVANILRNETYAGVWRFGKKIQVESAAGKARRATSQEKQIAVEVPPIVSRATWALARARMQLNLQSPDRGVKHEYLMRQRVCCHCGYKMGCRPVRNPWGAPGRFYLYYFCPSTQKNLVARTCSSKVFQSRVVDAIVWEWVKRVLVSPEQVAHGYQEYLAEADNKTRHCGIGWQLLTRSSKRTRASSTGSLTYMYPVK